MTGTPLSEGLLVVYMHSSVKMSARVFEVKTSISIFNTKILLDDALNLKYKIIFIFLAVIFVEM